MIQLNWNTALVTGSSRGIGRGIAHKLVDAGIERIAVNYVGNDTAANERGFHPTNAGLKRAPLQW